MKQWVIPDLHGCLRTLIGMIEDRIRPTKEDELYFLGDYVDRGPDPKGVLDYIMNLEEQGFKIFPLRGNHEEYILLALENERKLKRRFLFFKERNRLYDEWMSVGGASTMKSFGVNNVNQVPEKYVEWIKRLKYYYILENHILVHAGLNFSRRDPFDDLHSILWASSFTPMPEKVDNKIVIHGHVAVSLEFLQNVLADPSKKYIPLDTGCHHSERSGMGNLVALELNTMELLIQPNIEK